jgi:hypothetical protein
MQLSHDPHYRHRFPAEIIGHPVWLYHVFSQSGACRYRFISAEPLWRFTS